jgi:hypothetical protein
MELSSGTTEHNVVGVEFTTVNDDDKFDPFGVFTMATEDDFDDKTGL